MLGNQCEKKYPPEQLQKTRQEMCKNLWTLAEGAIKKYARDKNGDKIKTRFAKSLMIKVVDTRGGQNLQTHECFKEQLYHDNGFCRTTESNPNDPKWGICSSACKWIGRENKVNQCVVKTPH